jgi:hypothetical protein
MFIVGRICVPKSVTIVPTAPILSPIEKQKITKNNKETKGGRS